ncbi:hypothetical protein Drose_06000 [Dactylosporangium roseum]|uniref:Uncharacterized protein n=1 Tax=Dactylosporangium roseum TaxID=47989 RepID=A0ABY5Z6Z7_9ACTN|nr:hypothetical protein [Dactylosporangium roseum]UWZ37824.1 hypothetical protein Drose_06000 [Dactylosporangium roseum]
MNQITAFLSTLSGLVLFGAAYYIHQKVRLTRTACVIAAAAGLLTYTSAIGTWVNSIAAKASILLVAAVVVGICVIVADVKGKKKGADRPALFAFFLVPLFLVAFISTLPNVLDQVGDSVDRVTQQTVK